MPFAYHFVVAHQDPVDYARRCRRRQTRDYNEMQHFHSRPELEPPSVRRLRRAAAGRAGDIFAAPYAGPGPTAR